MPSQGWISPLNLSPASTGVAGTTLATAATLAISPTSSTAPDYILPAEWLTQGGILRFTANGIFTCGSTATNATFALMYGGTGGVVLATTGPLAMLVNSTTLSWELEALLTCRASGTSGTAWTQGNVSGIVASVSQSTSRMDSSVFGTPAVATIDTTAAKALVLNGTLSQITGSPTIICHQWLIEG